MFIVISFETPQMLEIIQRIQINSNYFEYQSHVSITEDGDLETTFDYAGKIFSCVNMNLPQKSRLKDDNHKLVLIV